MKKFSDLPIQIISPGDLPEDQVSFVRSVIIKHFSNETEPTANYRNLKVVVGLHESGWPEKITIHLTYADRYFFETKEIYLDKNGEVINHIDDHK